MKRLIILLSIFFSCQLSHAQFDFPNDSAYRPFLKSTYKQIDRKFHLEKAPEFELRIWTNSFVMGISDLFILSYKQSKWTARLFRNTDYKEIDEKRLPDIYLDSLWAGLMANNVLTIPESKFLKDSSGREAQIGINDGTHYVFELSAGKNKRSYFYHCPQTHAEEYKYIKEFTQVVNILKLIFSFCNTTDDEILCMRIANEHDEL